MAASTSCIIPLLPKMLFAKKFPFEFYMPYSVSKKEAKDYMINLQLGFRNLSLSQISYLLSLRYNIEKSDNLVI